MTPTRFFLLWYFEQLRQDSTNGPTALPSFLLLSSSTASIHPSFLPSSSLVDIECALGTSIIEILCDTFPPPQFSPIVARPCFSARKGSTETAPLLLRRRRRRGNAALLAHKLRDYNLPNIAVIPRSDAAAASHFRAGLRLRAVNVKLAPYWAWDIGSIWIKPLRGGRSVMGLSVQPFPQFSSEKIAELISGICCTYSDE